MKNLIFRTLGFIVFVATSTSFVSATPVVRPASGANPAAIQATVDQFRTDLGGANNGVGASFTSGRREINWDGVPDNFASPNNLPVDFFNVNSPRGVVFNSFNSISIRVSADSSNPTTTPVRFADIDPSYSTEFQTFSAERLFAVSSANAATLKHNLIEITFFIPGTKIPATVNGFGAVLTDVDTNASALIEYYAADGSKLFAGAVPAQDKGLSFLGVSFNAGERVARVVINCGTNLAPGNTDSPGVREVAAMDDFIYGEPRAAEYHASDFDGDGTSDFAVYRPSAGAWFVLNSGSNTFQAFTFGTNGDIPVEGDFDGDRRTDITVFRPSTGTWFRLDSSNNGFSATNFGTNGDKPSPGDYDKDGKTDIAVWRPSSGSYFILRSSNGAFQATQWGANGDIPIAASPGP